jgi:hypothetical protein
VCHKAGKLLCFSIFETTYFAKKQDLKTLFDIRSEKAVTGEHGLLMEVGSDYCTYAIWHPSSQTIDQLKFVSFDETESEERIPEIISDMNSASFQSVHVCAAYPQSVLVPTKYFNNNYDALDLIYEQSAQHYLHDRIAEWQMVNMYAIPGKIHSHMQNTFQDVQFVHAYTLSIKVYNGFVSDNQLMVHFTPHHFRVLLKKDSAIHLAQTYQYATPLDVVYYLLKICYEFSLDQSGVYIILSGLVEKESSLYTELEQYFINIHFASPPTFTLPDNTHPHYFFSSLYNLATCVS